MIVVRPTRIRRAVAAATMAIVLAALASGGVVSSGDDRNDDDAPNRSVGGGFELVSDMSDSAEVAVLSAGGGFTLVGGISVDSANELEPSDAAIVEPGHIDGTPGPVVAPAAKSCSVDRNHDGLVNVDDVLALISAWGPCQGDPPRESTPGTKAPSRVNVDDMVALLATWGMCP